MKNRLEYVHNYIIMGADLALFSLAHFTAYLLRFDFELNAVHFEKIRLFLPILLIVKFAVFWFFGCYRNMWRYFSLEDLWRLLKSCIFAGLCVHFLMIVATRFQGFSRAVFIMDAGFTFLYCGALRIGIRYIYHRRIRLGGFAKLFSLIQPQIGLRTIIVGAGDAGEKTLRELTNDRGLKMNVVGFLDDDARKQGLTIHNIPVLGTIQDLPLVVKNMQVADVLIAIPSATGMQMRRMVDICKSAGARFRTLPSLGELIDGKVSIQAIREVNFEDLLGRPSVSIDASGIESYIKEHSVLITGAGGSIGAELCRQLVRFDPGRLILMDISESNLYAIQMELKHRIGFSRYMTVLGNVSNPVLVDKVFKKYQPHTVFHAAAYKHVPMLQRNSWEAVLNNVRGTYVMMEASIHKRVKKFVLVSTDKAVRPTNIMGASKRICELLMSIYQGYGTRFMGVRFGNVVGSSGSVIPLFRQQIEAGGPVTVTHPEISRYFMTIPEAAQLILQAGALGEGGEIFILEMGTPVKIADLAKDMIRLSGKDTKHDIQIVFTGLRPGEKLFEELITRGEGISETLHEKIKVLKQNGVPREFINLHAYRRWLLGKLNALYFCAENQDTAGTVSLLMELVPEYEPKDTDACILNGDKYHAIRDCSFSGGAN